MSVIDFIILGEIQNGNKHPYIIADKVVNFDMVKISKPAVYKNAIKLHDKGFLNREIEQKTKMPARKVYSVNYEGEKEFKRLAKEIIKNPLTGEFNAIFIYSAFVDFNILVDELLKNLNNLKDKYKNKEDIFIKQKYLLVLTYINWIEWVLQG